MKPDMIYQDLTTAMFTALEMYIASPLSHPPPPPLFLTWGILIFRSSTSKLYIAHSMDVIGYSRGGLGRSGLSR